MGLARRSFTACILLCAFAAPSAFAAFTAFESGLVRPLALSPDGATLYAVNTPDNRLEIFAVASGNLTYTGSVEVGLEPVAVAAVSNSEVWVVNHLSDSISVVDVGTSPPTVTRTLLVGDEPRDIVVAVGTVGTRVMITSARRGQNSTNHSTDPIPPRLTTAGVGRALVWVFDPGNLGTNLEGNPISVVELFGDTPRALTVSPDGNSVFAAVFHSGNQTATVSEGAVCDTSNFNLNNDNLQGSCIVGGQTMPGGLPLPHDNDDGDFRPETGLIVKFDGADWVDELGRSWNNAVKFDLPDSDVFEISTTSGAILNTHAGVGTINFNMVTNPVSGNVYVSNTEAINEVRFEGPGIHAASFKPVGEPATVQGHLHESRITVIEDLTNNVNPRHLNKHIDYDVLPSPGSVKANSLATPTDMAITSDGTTLYVAAFGSGKIGVFNTALLEADTFVPSSLTHIPVGGGPIGLVLDEANDRLYALNRFDNTISIVDTNTQSELGTVAMYNPEPANIVDGRPILYDANLTSSNGEASCSSCHIFGDLDSLAWDLGNPDDELTINNLPLNNSVPDIGFKDFHPMKGPMTTQTLRGMNTHGALHWRGDRSVGFFGNSPTDEVLSFRNFIVAFEGLVGHDGLISVSDMDLFTGFMLDVLLPPNPVRPLDNSLGASEQSALTLYNGPATDSGVESCNGCHRLSPELGFFGADGGRSFENETQHMKVAHLRNIYQKIGMFGMPQVPFITPGDNGHKGSQIRGFGFLHDGSIDTVKRFLTASVFNLSGSQETNLESLMFQFDSNLAPVVGQQVTLNDTNSGIAGPRIDLLIDRARTCFDVLLTEGTTECELIVKGTSSGESRGWVGELQGPCGPAQTVLFRSDRAGDPTLTDGQLRALASIPGDVLTYTCAPPGSGERMGIDRDEDSFLDQDEEDAGSDPADPLSIPGTTSATVISAKKLFIKDRSDDNESRRKIVLVSKDASITFPAQMSANDPRCNGQPSGSFNTTLTIASSASGETHSVDLACQNWKALGNASNHKGYRYRDRELDDGTAQVVTWRAGKLRVVLRGKGPSTLDYDLTLGLSQSTVDVLFDNNGDGLCMACTPFNGKDGSDGKKYLAKSCAAPASCGL